jgi:hypothetical protein
VLVSANEALLATPELVENAEAREEGLPEEILWTDDHASLFEILRR